MAKTTPNAQPDTKPELILLQDDAECNSDDDTARPETVDSPDVAQIRPLIHIDPSLRVLPNLSEAEQKALDEDVAARQAVLTEIVVTETGGIVDGLGAWTAASRAGIADYPVRVLRGMTHKELLEYARARNSCRRTISGAQRRQMIVDQLEDTPHYADRRIAAVCGADHKTVQVIREALEASGDLRHIEKRLCLDGRWRSFARRTAAKKQRDKATTTDRVRLAVPGHAIMGSADQSHVRVPRADDLPLERGAKLPPGQLTAEWIDDDCVRISRHGYALVDIPVQHVPIGQIVKRSGNRKVENNALIVNSCSSGCCRALTGFHATYRPCYSDVHGMGGCFGGHSEYALQHGNRQEHFNIAFNGATNNFLKIRLPRNGDYGLPPPVLGDPLEQEWLCRVDSETTDGTLSIALGIYQRYVAANPGMRFLSFLSHYFHVSDETLTELAALENHHLIHSLSGWFLHETPDGIIRDDHDSRLASIRRFEDAGVRGVIGICTRCDWDNEEVLRAALDIMPRERVFEIPFRRGNHDQEQPLLDLNPLGACGDYRLDSRKRPVRFIEEGGKSRPVAVLPDGKTCEPYGAIHARCAGCQLQCAAEAAYAAQAIAKRTTGKRSA